MTLQKKDLKHVGDLISDKLYIQVRQARGKFHNQFHNQVWNRVESKIWYQVYYKINKL